MICHYPNCRSLALWTPVFILPTIRTVGETKQMVQTTQPTYLLGREVCQRHRDTYNLLEWFGQADWSQLQEAARANGYLIPAPKLMTVEFRPLNWHPRNTLELERP